MNHDKKLGNLLTGLLPILLCVLAVGGLLLGERMASAQDSGPTTVGNTYCMQTVFSGQSTEPVPNSDRLNCTANDIAIAEATHVSPETCTQGLNFDLTATFLVDVNASERYDPTFFFNVGGGINARLAEPGPCSLSQLDPDMAPADNLDSDSCGDVTSAGQIEVTFTIPNVTCNDSDGDGILNLPNCTSWHNNAGTFCEGPDDGFPETKSKCKCDDTFQVPVLVEKPEITVAKTADPTEVDEPGGSVNFTVKVTNPAIVTDVTITSIVDDPDNNPSTNNSVTFDANSDPTLSEICDLLILLKNGGMATCTFPRTVSGEAGAKITDQACVTGIDSNGNPVGPRCDTATVAIKDVLPTAAVLKTVEGFVCADVIYKVKVENTSTSETLGLTALSDDKFGDITIRGGAISSTTCSVPQRIATSSNYSCSFVAEVCSSPHMNTLEGTLNDNDGNTIKSSGSATAVITVGPPAP